MKKKFKRFTSFITVIVLTISSSIGLGGIKVTAANSQSICVDSTKEMSSDLSLYLSEDPIIESSDINVLQVECTGYTTSNITNTTIVKIRGVGVSTGTATINIYNQGRSLLTSIDVQVNAHAWSESYTVDRNATCTEAGSRSIHCKKCDTIKAGTTEAVPVLEHQWNVEYTLDKEVSCIEDGRKSIHCQQCNTIKAGTVEVISALGHDWDTEYMQDKEASCMEDGSRSIHCKKCNAIKAGTVETITASGHNSYTQIVNFQGSADKRLEIRCSICTATLWASNRISKYTVSFNLNGGTGSLPKKTVNMSKGIAFPDEDSIKRTGYKLTKWEYEYTDVDGNKTKHSFLPGESSLIDEYAIYDKALHDTGNVTVKASWSPISYKLILDINGGIGNATESTLMYGEEKNLGSSGIWKDGYGILEWNTKKDGSGTSYKKNGYVSNLSTKDGDTVILYAQWRKQVAIWFNNMFSQSNLEYMVLGEKYSDFIEFIPKREGDVFVGWYSMDGRKINANSVITESSPRELYAEWKSDLRPKSKGIWRYNSVGWWYDLGKGDFLQGGQFIIEGKTYCFTRQGYMITGWNNDNGQWYYYGSDGAMKIGWVKVAGSWYYMESNEQLNNNGKMVTGEKKIGATTYYFSTSGALRTGWIKDSGKWYYYSSSRSILKNWQRIGTIWYYLDPNTGVMYDNKWLSNTYFLKSDGQMAVGWLKINGRYYYFSNSGSKVTNQWIGNYYLKKDGIMAVNERVDKGKYYVGSNGAWIPGR